ncbi:DNA gyrase C-terminal beta-propeller domain-containing protein, partial [Arthrospira platensis SPKY2]
LDTIYKSTELQTSFAVKLDVVYDFENFHVSLRSLILNWIEFRRETKRRFAASNYSSIRKQVHLLEAIVTILDKKGGYEELVKIGAKSRNRTDMIEKLISKFKLTDIQAEALADMRLYKISIENKENYKKDLKKAKQMEKEIKSILEDDEGLDKLIIEELKYFKKQYCFGRKSNIISCSDINEIPESKHIIALTKEGYIKKLDINYSGIGDIEQGDYITQLFKANNTDELLIFDSLGTAYSLPVFGIENTGKKKGIKIDKLIKIPSKAEVVSMIVKPTSKEIENSDKMLYLTFATKDGIVKKSLLKYYVGAGASGIIGINLAEKDKLVSVILMKGDKNIILYTQHGKYIKYNTEDISETKRVSKGVIGIKLAKDDIVVGLEALNKNKNYVVILTNKGNGKKCLLRNFDVSKRGTAGNQLIKLGSGEEIRVVMSARSANSIDIYTYEEILELNVEDIPEMLKITPGKKILKLGRKNDILKAVLK